MSNPRCPVTGEPAERLVQWISRDFLATMWRIEFNVDARSSLGDSERIGLWQSPTGLYFFDPMREGERSFYTEFYAWLMKRNLWSRTAVRDAFFVAARRISPGHRVLDVGCGFASFRATIPESEYVGLDPNFGGVEGVRKESLQQHLVDHAGAYDAVCAFEVLEHLSSPVSMFADMMKVVRPGGLVIVSMPHVPSAATRIPNFLLNGPPHHLTWWTEPALRALAAGGGADIVSIERTQWNATDSLIYWIARCTPIRCGDAHFRGNWAWHLSALVGFLAGRCMYVLDKSPKAGDEGAGLVLVARRRLSGAVPREGA